MVVVIVVGIIALLFSPSSAQDGLDGECWTKITTCITGTTPGEFQQQCCPVITQEIANERECFCGIKPFLRRQNNDTIVDGFVQLFSLCSVNLDTTCPDTFQDAPCWRTIHDCIESNVNNTTAEPRFNQSNPLFNATEFLCCPLMQQTATTEKQCFCTIDTFVQQNPSLAQNTSDFLSVCSLPNSPASLNGFCQGEAPSPSPNVAPSSPLEDEGSLESLHAASPATNPEKTSGQLGAGNKIVVTGSLPNVLVFMAYLISIFFI